MLSTYNGEKYILAQIESILTQSYQDVSILIRDDGSTDNTVLYIEGIADKYQDRIRFFSGKNIGVKESFFELLRQADPLADYYSFCDQDDIWMENKLVKAVSLLNKEEIGIPLLYFTPTYLTDELLEIIKIWPKYSIVEPSFYNALSENIVVGTTAIINNHARELLMHSDIDFQNMIMHDWWIYLCISAFGKVVYDNEASVLYRQHQGNQIGGNKNFIGYILRKWRSFIKNIGKRVLYIQAREFMKCYGDRLYGEKKTQLELFIAPRNTLSSRISYLYKSKLYRHSFVDNYLLKFLILSGYL